MSTYKLSSCPSRSARSASVCPAASAVLAKVPLSWSSSKRASWAAPCMPVTAAESEAEAAEDAMEALTLSRPERFPDSSWLRESSTFAASKSACFAGSVSGSASADARTCWASCSLCASTMRACWMEASTAPCAACTSPAAAPMAAFAFAEAWLTARMALLTCGVASAVSCIRRCCRSAAKPEMASRPLAAFRMPASALVSATCAFGTSACAAAASADTACSASRA